MRVRVRWGKATPGRWVVVFVKDTRVRVGLGLELGGVAGARAEDDDGGPCRV